MTIPTDVYTERTPNLGRFLTIAMSLVFIAGLLLTTVTHANAEADVASVTFPVEGMVCPFCEASVEKLLGKVDGVVAVEASAATGTVQVNYHPSAVSPQQLIAVINTNTLYRAYPPGTETPSPTPVVALLNRMPLLLSGVTLLIGFGAWWIFARRSDHATGTPTRHEPQDIGENV